MSPEAACREALAPSLCHAEPHAVADVARHGNHQPRLDVIPAALTTAGELEVLMGLRMGTLIAASCYGPRGEKR